MNLQPINQFSNEFSGFIGIKPEAVKRMIDRNFCELNSIGAVFKTKGKSRLVDHKKFMEWYLNE